MADIDLLFGHDDREPLELVFGDDGTAAPPEYTLHAGHRITGLHGHSTVRASAQLHAAYRITGLHGFGVATYDVNVSRGLIARAGEQWEEAKHVAAPARADFQASHALVSGGRADAQHGIPIAAAARTRWQRSTPLTSGARSEWQHGIPRTAGTRTQFQRSIALVQGARQHFQNGVLLVTGSRSGFQQTIQLRIGAAQHWQESASRINGGVLQMEQGQRLGRLWTSRYQNARRPPNGKTAPPPIPPDWCYHPENPIELVFEPDDRAGLDLLFWCGQQNTPVGPPAKIVVPARRVYIVLNDIELRRVDGNIKLPCYTLALSLDADSWTWQWSATLHKSALPNLEPAKSGEHVEVEAIVNGVPYRLLVEGMSRSRQFPTVRINVTGRGLAAALDAPYAPVLSFTNEFDRTANQLMSDALTLNGVSIGWDVDFGLTDWTVPAGAWVHHGSYISAINAIAQAAGGYVQPHPTDKTLRILHRYPYAPWDWADVEPDIELPINPIAVEGVEWVTKPAYNRVITRGEAYGVQVGVTRTGTAGDEIAQMVVDPLITHVDAARQRGRAVLSDTGPQANVSLTLQVLPETGLILPGTFLRRTDGSEILQGYTRSMSMSWEGAGKLRQTVEIQTHG